MIPSKFQHLLQITFCPFKLESETQIKKQKQKSVTTTTGDAWRPFFADIRYADIYSLWLIADTNVRTSDSPSNARERQISREVELTYLNVCSSAMQKYPKVILQQTICKVQYKVQYVSGEEVWSSRKWKYSLKVSQHCTSVQFLVSITKRVEVFHHCCSKCTLGKIRKESGFTASRTCS